MPYVASRRVCRNAHARVVFALLILPDIVLLRSAKDDEMHRFQPGRSNPEVAPAHRELFPPLR